MIGNRALMVGLLVGGAMVLAAAVALFAANE